MRLGEKIIPVPRKNGFRVGEKILIVTRPEMIRFSDEEEAALPGVIREVSFLGSLARYWVEMKGGERVQVDEPNPRGFREMGTAVRLVLDPEALHLQKADPAKE